MVTVAENHKAEARANGEVGSGNQIAVIRSGCRTLDGTLFHERMTRSR